MMNYKVIKYRCGCKYIIINDKSKTVLPRHTRCPQHWQAQDYVLLWCVDCGLRIKTTPKAGHNQARCQEHSTERKREINRELYRTRYKGRYKYTGKTKYSQKETQKEEAVRQINEWAESCRVMFMPPVLEGMV